jgi:Big-like domain-containing protein
VAGKQSKGRRSESLGVRRWLQLGAASAGVSAALFGLSSLGPQVGVALADDSGSASSDSGGSAGSDAGGSATSGSPTGSAASGSASNAGNDSGPKTSVGSSPSSSVTDEGDTKKDPETKKDDAAELNAVVTKTVTGSSSPAHTTKPEPEQSAALVSTPAPEITKTVAPDSVPSPALVAAEPTPPWAVQVEAPEDARKQFITDQLTAWTSSSQGWIDSLPVPEALRWHLEGALWTTRRSLFNVAPTVAPLTVTGLSNTVVNGRVDAVDPEGDAIVYRLVRGPSSGSLQLNADGTFTYTPPADFDGVASFVVLAQDLGFHVNLVDPFRGLGTAANALVNQGAITFDFNYATGSQYWSAEARDALQSVANDLAVYFLVTAPVVITYDVAGDDNTSSDASLAGAGSDLVSGEPGFWRTVVQNKLLSGVDSNGAAADGEITWNWAYSWALGDTVDDGSYDFESTALHELLHSFGFLSYVDASGKNTDERWALLDSFIVNSDGSKPIGTDFEWNSEFDPYLTGAAGGLYFGGANAFAAYGNQYVPLFTPNPWEDGSSMSHLDDATFTGPDQKLMNAQTGMGLGVRVLSPIEVGILRDIGYTIVPQAPAAAMAMVGLIFVRGLRRKSSARAR